MTNGILYVKLWQHVMTKRQTNRNYKPSCWFAWILLSISGKIIQKGGLMRK